MSFFFNYLNRVVDVYVTQTKILPSVPSLTRMLMKKSRRFRVGSPYSCNTKLLQTWSIHTSAVQICHITCIWVEFKTQFNSRGYDVACPVSSLTNTPYIPIYTILAADLCNLPLRFLYAYQGIMEKRVKEKVYGAIKGPRVQGDAIKLLDGPHQLPRDMVWARANKSIAEVSTTLFWIALFHGQGLITRIK